ncbi:hypothetical protein H4R33_005290 [Dimargaris cristalligena]|uniref:Uncharacterized protein n=1 Tax=Dimargaris cristalligena TaxID=215637 RepID=A0A4P9ZVJ9_9FUNG|nr:hypothetical protein H4R33_005290 [Dimargaris cristalligena]RKP37656.1 hypothetical protein BJ085DRAFT_40875 [Dimargaris cristalligena]|eukprot:RKP37656.1 hypothetical protein BJ085DRAFT_40875 [Dimargaris cristalligena]
MQLPAALTTLFLILATSAQAKPIATDSEVVGPSGAHHASMLSTNLLHHPNGSGVPGLRRTRGFRNIKSEFGITSEEFPVDNTNSVPADGSSTTAPRQEDDHTTDLEHRPEDKSSRGYFRWLISDFQDRWYELAARNTT